MNGDAGLARRPITRIPPSVAEVVERLPQIDRDLNRIDTHALLRQPIYPRPRPEIPVKAPSPSTRNLSPRRPHCGARAADKPNLCETVCSARMATAKRATRRAEYACPSSGDYSV